MYVYEFLILFDKINTMTHSGSRLWVADAARFVIKPSTHKGGGRLTWALTHTIGNAESLILTCPLRVYWRYKQVIKESLAPARRAVESIQPQACI